MMLSAMISRVRRVTRRWLSYARQAYQASPVLAMLTGCAAVAAAVIPLANVAIIGMVVGTIPRAVHDGAGSAAAGSAVLWAALAGVLLALQFVVGGLQTASTTALGNRLDLALQRRLMASVMRPAGIAHLERPEVMSLVRVGGETFRAWLKPGRAVWGCCSLFTARVGQLGACVLLAVFNPVLAVLVLAASFWAEHEIQQTARRETAHHVGGNELARRQEYFYELGVTPAAAKEIRVFGLPAFLRERFADSWQQSARFLFARRERGSLLATVTLAAVALGGLGWLTARALDGTVGIGWASAFAQAILMAASMLGATSVARTQAALALETFAKFEAAISAIDNDGQAGEPTGEEAAAAGRPGAPPAASAMLPAGRPPQRQIRFENVRFRYPGAARYVLDGLDLTIPVGRSLAIVGANGAGKTTLVKLLCRLYEPTAGRITVDDRELAEIEPASWQRTFAPVFQDYIRYELPARANIGLGYPARQDDLEGIQAAAAEAGIAGRIARLPDGWDAILSSGHDKGSELSGGEWQRVALARALFSVRHGARIMVLDEPAANLDARAEAELYQQFLTITRGITTIVISHRFSTVRQASSIVVLVDGRVAEQGTHDELLALDGKYATMFRLQAARFEGVTVR